MGPRHNTAGTGCISHMSPGALYGTAHVGSWSVAGSGLRATGPKLGRGQSHDSYSEHLAQVLQGLLQVLVCLADAVLPHVIQVIG